MFQYVWYDKNSLSNTEQVSIPDEYIDFSDIKRIASPYWSEHCTECAVPHCYHNCVNWQPRIDNKCRRFTYGIKYEPSKRSYCAKLQLKRWGKIESVFFNRHLSPIVAKWIDSANYYLSNFVRAISAGVRFLSPNYKLNGFLEFLKNKIFSKFGSKGCLNTFLLSCYLHDAQPCTLFLELYNPNSIICRKNLNLIPGYNQLVLDMEDYEMQVTDNTRVRIFGSENVMCEATFFFLDFVELNETGKLKSLPQNQAPADKVKCVVWDLDNTIWDGILIESDPEKLALKQDVLQTIQWLDSRGIIQCICSKNEERSARNVLKRLGIDGYFVYFAINWMPKSINLYTLAKELNINVDTFAFVDDSEHERAEVGKQLPCVRVFKETDIVEFASHPAFDVPVTEDSKNRRKLYQINKERNEYKVSHTLNHIEFLNDCELVANISHIDTPEKCNRSYELLLRTNQLNLSGRKYEKDVFEHLVEEKGDQLYVLELSDRFGAYGQSMFFYAENREDAIYVTEFTLSCRVAGKCVESAVLYWLTKKDPNKPLYMVGKNTKKNSLLVNTLADIGLCQISGSEESDLILFYEAGKTLAHSDVVKIVDNC